MGRRAAFVQSSKQFLRSWVVHRHQLAQRLRQLPREAQGRMLLALRLVQGRRQPARQLPPGRLPGGHHREEQVRARERCHQPDADGAVDGIGGGVGGRWDVGQWSGYTGGDSQNRGGQGIGAGRRQIVGPRPLPGAGR